MIVKKSRILGAGLGLFTENDLESDQIVIEYQGKLVHWKNHTDHRYCYDISPDYCLNAENSDRLAKYINDSLGTEYQNNLEWILDNDRIFLKSTRKIDADEELYVAYGFGYWNVHSNGIESIETAMNKYYLDSLPMLN
jgi:hypothetical protein